MAKAEISNPRPQETSGTKAEVDTTKGVQTLWNYDAEEALAKRRNGNVGGVASPPMVQQAVLSRPSQGGEFEKGWTQCTECGTRVRVESCVVLKFPKMDKYVCRDYAWCGWMQEEAP